MAWDEMQRNHWLFPGPQGRSEASWNAISTEIGSAIPRHGRLPQRRRSASTAITHRIFAPAFTEPEMVPDTLERPIRRR